MIGYARQQVEFGDGLGEVVVAASGKTLGYILIHIFFGGQEQHRQKSGKHQANVRREISSEFPV